MKKWNTPAIDTLEVVATANADKPGTQYDDTWTQDNNGQWYLLAKES